jgi:hypothetical protein
VDRRTEPLVGWRVWRVAVRRDGPRLVSALHDDVWLPGEEAVARCEHVDDPLAPPVARRHAAPDRACSCGIYAARTREQALPYLIGRNDPWIVGRVLGTVALTGLVIEAEHGFRGARAYPVRLWAPPTLGRDLAAYGVEVTAERAVA